MTRLIIFTVTLFFFGWLVAKGSSFILILCVGAGVAFQLMRFGHVTQEHETTTPNSNAPLPDLSSISFDEPTQSFKSASEDVNVKHHCSRMNEAYSSAKMARRERDSDYQFFRNIVQHVGIGLLTFKKDGAVQIINSAARRLLRVNQIQNITELNYASPTLVESFQKLKTGGRELIRLKIGDDTVQLSVFAIELTLRGEEIKLISMSNIQSELEEKEMEAWQNLVRVLTHEIMNSVTPISSLAGTVEEELQQQLQKDSFEIKRDELEDMHLSLQTISRRSAGLIKFVKEFRNLTQVPQPRLSEIAINPLLEEMAMLHKKELSDRGITITVKTDPPQLTALADKYMIEQVLINLIKNAIQAFEEQTDKKIELSAYTSDKGRPIISITDNGPGIDPEALEKIFIPFFSTKKTGSGIGLSLSRQIMRVHEGRITAKSTVGEGTEFLLRF
ncbi:MAG: GHKL domain-containing protein [Cyclobacteriaceae bacterium]|nr:GHKL domain-containing protein [Cyclobacteriaceae bacterium]